MHEIGIDSHGCGQGRIECGDLQLKVVLYEAWQDLVLRGTETILLVDHEEMIRNMVKLGLEDLGYTVLTACDGQEGVAIYAPEKDRIDLVLLNMVLPDMGVRDCYERIIGLNSEARFIIAGVFSADHHVRAILEHSGSFGYLRKPYDIVQLSHRIRDVIERPER